MECEKVRNGLHAYAEGVAVQEERAFVEAHLASCARCRTSLADLQETLKRVKALEEVEPPRWLTQKVMSRIREEQESRQSFLSRLFLRLPGGLPASAVATAIIAVVAVILVRSMQPEIREVMRPAVSEKQFTPSSVETPPPAGPKPKGGATLQPQPVERTAPSLAQQDRPIEKKIRESPAQPQEGPGKAADENRIASEGDFQQPSDSKKQAAVPAVPPMPAFGKATGPLPSAGASRDAAASKTAPRNESAGSLAEPKKERSAGGTEPVYEKVVEERYAGGAARVVVTYRVTEGRRRKVMEERFDEQGRRHGAHVAYDEAGRIMAEVWYEHGRIGSIKEYEADGTLKKGESTQDWPWLRQSPG